MKIEFILSHCKNRKYQMLSMMSSIVAQTNPNWKIHVVCDGKVDDLEYLSLVFPNFENIKYSTLDKNYNDFGHTPKNFGVVQSTEEWIVLGANDNYYVPCFVDKILKQISNNSKINFIYFDMIHSYFDYNLFKCKPVSHYIDMGSFVTKSELARKNLLDITRRDADGIFVEKYIKNFCTEENICYMPHVYFVHN